jgi:hypothetical protein
MLTSAEIKRAQGRPRIADDYEKFKQAIEFIVRAQIPVSVGSVAAILGVSWHGSDALLRQMFLNGLIGRLPSDNGWYYFAKLRDNPNWAALTAQPSPSDVTPSVQPEAQQKRRS